MIELSRIIISFNKREIIKDSKITIKKGKVTTIIGESGSGKTTLLYCIGLISSQSEYEYLFDGKKLDLKSDKDKSLIRKNVIGYVFQDNNLFEDVSVYDNIILSAKIVNQKISKDEVEHLLEYVQLNTIDCNSMVNNLSCGERQRLAIACVLAKKPKLIIADEPTSSLDSQNSALIMDILLKIAHIGKSMVVIATHSKDIYEKSDVIYQIKDHKVQLLKTEELNKLIPIDNKCETFEESEKQFPNKTQIGFYLDYVRNKLKTKKITRNIMAVLCALAISLCACAVDFGNSFIEQQEGDMNKISNREVFIINLTAPGNSDVNYEENLILPENDEKLIVNSSYVDTTYSFIELKSTGFDYKTETPITDSEIKINGSQIIRFSLSNPSNIGKQQYTILPYYPEQNIKKRAEYTFQSGDSSNDDGIYISSSLAKVLGISNNFDTCTLDVNVRVPVFCYNTVMSNHADESITEYNIDIDMTDAYSTSLNVAGVLQNDVTNIYSDSGDYVIYMPYEEIMKIVNEFQQECNYAGNLFSYAWRPSAMMVYAKEFSVINQCIQTAEKINSNFVCVNQYQDIETMNESIDSLKNTISIFSLIVLFIVIVLMSVIYINKIINRRYEFAILKANGLMRYEVNKLLFLETGVETIKSIVISIIFACLLMIVSRAFFGEGMIMLNIITVLRIALISFVSIN
ncbi:MAG: ATP-binding cassette domain-containing protein, partial [Bacilli bacterium]